MAQDLLFYSQKMLMKSGKRKTRRGVSAGESAAVLPAAWLRMRWGCWQNAVFLPVDVWLMQSAGPLF